MDKPNKVPAWARWLREQRTKRRLSLRAMEREIPITRQGISDAERGIATEKTKQLLAEFYGLKIPTAEQVIQKALQPPTHDDLERNTIDDFNHLSPETQKIVSAWIRFLRKDGKHQT